MTKRTIQKRQRLGVKKTYKLFIGGKFPRTESGRAMRIMTPDGTALLANVSRGSRKDLREAVAAAEKAAPKWRTATAYLRGQILYRIAEMLETRKSAFVEELTLQTGMTAVRARREVEAGVDRLVWYAGWADKFMQCFGSVNPVAGPYFNFSLPEPMGVVGVVCPDEAPLLGCISKVAPAIVSGNAVVVLPSQVAPLSALSFAEVLATSDLPGGVVNIIAGYRKELLPVLAKHMAVAAIDYAAGSVEETKVLRAEAPANLKRLIVRDGPTDDEWLDNDLAQSPYWITALCETKTAWHPIGV
jgi:acyl-CoA reductase-like NAD-dependent aldehyde dehydrogenase